MDGFDRATERCAPGLREALRAVTPEQRERVKEIRLYRDHAVELCRAEGTAFLGQAGELLPRASADCRVCTATEMQKTCEQMCDCSVHTHQEELRNGYIHTAEGCRVGIGGQAVTENGRMISVQHISSLCIRVPHEHAHCADTLMALMVTGEGLKSTLICGEPSSGKSSLLRDLLTQLPEKGYHVAVVDERGELTDGKAVNGVDVLRYYCKEQGIEQAVRCLSPDVVLMDELGTLEEARRLEEGLHAGVSAVATVHARSLAELKDRPAINRALRNGTFAYVVLLDGRKRPGRIRQIFAAEEWQHEMDRGTACGTRGVADRCSV